MNHFGSEVFRFELYMLAGPARKKSAFRDRQLSGSLAEIALSQAVFMDYGREKPRSHGR